MGRFTEVANAYTAVLNGLEEMNGAGEERAERIRKKMMFEEE